MFVAKTVRTTSGEDAMFLARNAIGYRVHLHRLHLVRGSLARPLALNNIDTQYKSNITCRNHTRGFDVGILGRVYLTLVSPPTGRIATILLPV